MVAEPGAVTRAVLAGSVDDHSSALAERLCVACVATLDVDGAALSLLTAHTARTTLYSSDPIADLIEELQFTLNDGACVEAATTGGPVLVPDLGDPAETTRWPAFAPALAERVRVGAIFAFPLQWGAVNLGVLDLYRVRSGGLAPGYYADLRRATDLAAVLVLGGLTAPGGAADGAGRTEWRESGTATHYEVHQATGMVLAQLGVGPVEALARMRAHAFAESRMLTDVARDVIARRLVFTEGMS